MADTLPAAAPEEELLRDVLMQISPCRRCELGGVCQCALDVRTAIYQARLNILSDAEIEAAEDAARIGAGCCRKDAADG